MSTSRFYRLTLSPVNEKITVRKANRQTGEIEDTEEARRKWELDIIITCLSIHARATKDIMESIACSKLLAEVKEMPEDKNFLDISDSELKHIKDGYQKTADGRPSTWWDCIGLLEQIVNPKKASETEQSE